MKSLIQHTLVALVLSAGIHQPLAQGTAFTYQGRLNAGSSPTTGTYDLRFTLYDANGGGTVIAGPVTNAATAVTNGLFTATLDFGAGAFTNQARWLEIAVRTNGSLAFSGLFPRQPITAAPYALYSPTAGIATSLANAAVTAVQLNTPTAPTPGQVLAWSGTSLAWSNVTTGGGGWALTGNSGTTPGVNFLGTTDNQPLELWANGSRALRLEPGTTPNIIGGRTDNTVAPGMSGVAIGGGAQNTIESGANFSSIAGGSGNNIQANDFYSTICGGQANTNKPGAWYATILGGYHNTVAGAYSLAAGWQANAAHMQTFVWSDGSYPTTSTANNQFMVRCNGGAVFYTGTGTSTGVQLASGGGSWSSLSDRDAKENFVPVDPQTVLAKVAELPTSTWNYKAQSAKVRHIGPMAQDFYAAFGVGEDDKHITTVDEGGVALAAIQGLNIKLQEKEAEIRELRSRLDRLEQALSATAQRR